MRPPELCTRVLVRSSYLYFIYIREQPRAPRAADPRSAVRRPTGPVHIIRGSTSRVGRCRI